MRYPKTDRAELVTSFLNDFLPSWLDKAESFLKKRGGIWLNGSRLSFGDLAMMVERTFLTHSEESAFTSINNAEMRAAVLESRPLLRGNMQRVMEVEEIAKYLRVRPAFNGR